MTCATARSVVSSRPWAASQGMSREASHCWADAWSTSSPTSSAQIASRRLSRPVVCGRSGLGHGSEGSEPGTRIGLGREGSAAPVSGAELSVTKARGRLARWERSRQDAGRGATAYRDDVSVRPADLIDRLVAGESSPTGKLERDRARRRSDLQNAAGRDTLKRRREQDLQATAELEVLGIDPVGCLPGGRRSRAAAPALASPSCSDAYPSRSPGYQRLHSLEVHRRAQAGVVVVHRQQRLRPPLRYLAVQRVEHREVAVVVGRGCATRPRGRRPPAPTRHETR